MTPTMGTTTSARPRRRPTRSGLLPEARHLILPKGIKSSGFPAIRETCSKIGIEFDPWQQDLNRCLLAKDSRGTYAADTAVLSISRQVGKTYDVGAVAFAKSIIIPGLTVVWTAHRFKVSRESFNEMRAWAHRSKLAPHIDPDAITSGANNEIIPFRNGSRIVFAARERGAIRGFTKVGMLVLDEAQILTEAALSDLVPTTNQAQNPLIILMGTPPKPTDPSEVFTRLRDEALKGESRDVLYVEISAESGCDPDDRAAWRQANPSYPKRTPAKAIMRMRKLLSAEDFMREALGVWDEAGTGLINPAAWASLAVDRERPVDPPVFFLDVSPGMLQASIGVAAGRDRIHVELADYGAGTGWLVARAVELAGDYPRATFVAEKASAIGALLPELAQHGIEPSLFTTQEMGHACAHLQKLVADRQVTHDGNPLFMTALLGAVKRDIGDGLWAWGRRKSTVDISPLVAITGAAWGLAAQESQPFFAAWR